MSASAPTMAHLPHRKDLEDCHLNLLDPYTTPEKALQSLHSPCLTHEAYQIGDKEPIVIFFAYIKFIMTRRPDACVDGIWEDILRKTLMYSKFVSGREMSGYGGYTGPLVSTWLVEALRSHSKCPNPYIRLELFHLICKYRDVIRNMDWECLCSMFIDTICDIQPHRLYPSTCGDNLQFGVSDLSHIITKCHLHGKLHSIINTSFHKQLEKYGEVSMYCKELMFISHCIQIVGVFADVTSFNLDPMTQDIGGCSTALMKMITLLVSCDDDRLMSIRGPFQSLASRPPLYGFVAETIRHITKVATNNYKHFSLYTRDLIVDNLKVYTKTCELPRLLLSRQVHGPSQVHHYALLLRNLNPLFRVMVKPAICDISSSTSDTNSESSSDDSSDDNDLYN